MVKKLTVLILFILIFPISINACDFHYLIPNFSYDKIIYSGVYKYTLDEEDVRVIEDEIYDKGYIQILVLDNYVFVTSYNSTGLYNINAEDINTIYQSNNSEDLLIIEMEDLTFKVIYAKDQSSNDNLLELIPGKDFYSKKENYEDIEPIYTSQNYLNHKGEYADIVTILEERKSPLEETEDEKELNDDNKDENRIEDENTSVEDENTSVDNEVNKGISVEAIYILLSLMVIFTIKWWSKFLYEN